MSKTSRCQCGNLKSTEAKQCKTCYDIYLELVWQGCANKPLFHQHDKGPDPRATCPDCGGQKDVRATRCRKCRGKVAPPPTHLRLDTCECGKQKLRKNEFCKACRLKRKPKVKRHPWKGMNQVRGGRYS